MSQSYKLTENSIRSINRTIRTVNQMRTTGPNSDLPFRQNAKRQPAAGATLQIGKTTAAWTKGTDATVEVYSKKDRTPLTKENGSKQTANVFNLFADIEADKWVAWIDGYLIAAECDDEEDSSGGG